MEDELGDDLVLEHTELKECGRIELVSHSKLVQKPQKLIAKKSLRKNRNREWWNKIWELFGNKYQEVEETTPTEEKISLLTWHPFRNVFSFVSKNIVHTYGYDKDTQKYQNLYSLSHEFQKRIRCIEWKPLSSDTLAVACKNCVLIWNEQWMSNYMIADDIDDITSIQWSPNSPLLAIGTSNTGITIWDTVTSLQIRLHATYPISSNLLRWSPNGHYLFQSSSDGTAFVWETFTWTREKWTFSDTKLQACWSPDSHFLLVAQKKTFNLIAFRNEPPSIGGTIISQVKYTSNNVIGMQWNSMGHIMIQFNDQYAIASLTPDFKLDIQTVENLVKVSTEYCTLRPNSNTLLFFDEIFEEEMGDDMRPKSSSSKFYKALRFTLPSQ